MAKVAFVHNVASSWVDRDREIISSCFNTDSIFLEHPYDVLKFRWILTVFRSEVAYFWFGSLHFFPLIFLAKIMGKKIIIVSGGYDVANVPHIKYGAFATGNTLSRYLRRLMFGMADTVLCVSQSNLDDTIQNARVSKISCRLVYHGFEKPDFSVSPWDERKSQVVMISRANKDTFLLKGINYFISLALSLPELNFLLIGDIDKHVHQVIKESGAKNLTTTGFLEFKGVDFNQVLNESRFILMLSEYESFGCALIDGAVSGCYPVSSDSFALNEVNDGLGVVVRHGNLEWIKEHISRLNKAGAIDSQKISKAALDKFPYSARKEGIVEVIEGLLNG